MNQLTNTPANQPYTLTNDYHGTRATVIGKPGDIISARRARAIRAKLCGHADCTCGGNLGERGAGSTLAYGPGREWGTWVIE